MCICHSLCYTCLSSSAIMCVNIIVQCSEIYLALKCLIINMTWLCNALSKVISPLWLMQISKTYTFKHIVTDTCVYIVVTCVSPLCPFVILWVMRACLLFKGGAMWQLDLTPGHIPTDLTPPFVSLPSDPAWPQTAAVTPVCYEPPGQLHASGSLVHTLYIY